MPYIERDINGKIKSVFNRLQQGYAGEYLPDDNAEVLVYLNPVPLSDADEAENEIKGRKALLGIIRILADRFDVTEQQVIGQIRAKL